MFVERFEKFDEPIHTTSNDEIRLHIEGKLVHSMKIENIKIFTHWACVTMSGTIGYFIGGPELEWQLKELGAKFSKECKVQ